MYDNLNEPTAIILTVFVGIGALVLLGLGIVALTKGGMISGILGIGGSIIVGGGYIWAIRGSVKKG